MNWALAKNINQQRAILAELQRRETGDTLFSYLKSAWPLIEPKHPFVPGFHIEAICEHLEAVIDGEIKNLLINVPPRHAKSTIVSVALPSWTWTKSSEKKFIYGSHSFPLAKRDSVKTRNILNSTWYNKTFNIKWRLADDQNEKTNFVNTDGGFRRATSVMGAIIGEGGDVLVVDDPHSPRSVKSETQREAELDWMQEEFFTRINDPVSVAKIVIMQRLDEKDASAKLLAEGGWEHLMLPAEYESVRKCTTGIGWTDPRTEEGQPLWPERFKEGYANQKKMGAKAWAGQGQQRPAPQEGNIFKRDQFRYYKELPEEIEFTCLSIDLPFDEGGTFAVFQTWGRKGSNKYLIDQTRGQVGFSVQKDMIRAAIEKHRPNAIWIEKKANGAAMIDELNKEFAGIIPINPMGSKEVRAEAVQPQFESGNVYIPHPDLESWVEDYVEELIVFNNGAFNDQVDATTQALLKLNVKSHEDWTPISMTAPSKWT